MPATLVGGVGEGQMRVGPGSLKTLQLVPMALQLSASKQQYTAPVLTAFRVCRFPVGTLARGAGFGAGAGIAPRGARAGAGGVVAVLAGRAGRNCLVVRVCDVSSGRSTPVPRCKTLIGQAPSL